jgi:hypothetical protein
MLLAATSITTRARRLIASVPSEQRKDASRRLPESVQRPGRCRVREMIDRIDDPTPYCHAGSVTSRRELVRSPSAFRLSRVAIPPEHQAGGAPNVDLGYHGLKAKRGRSINV